MTSETPESDLVGLTSDIVSAYASNNQLRSDDLPGLIRSVHATLQGLEGGAAPEEAAPEDESEPLTPAVPIDQSVREDAVICLECGKAFKTLKRHLMTEHGLDPATYRERWQLSKDYPLVAPSYSKTRAATAKQIGLGRKSKK